MRSQQPKNHIVFRYLDFRAIQAGGITRDMIKKTGMSYVLTASKDDCRRIVKYLQFKGSEGRQNPELICLYLPATDEWPEFYVDQAGRVSDGKTEYTMTPYFYLKVSDYMDYLKFKNGIKDDAFLRRRP